ncbi:MAG: sigma-E processing peptidase SpoIIGA, partial [Clostridia bacterium]|nr:sigma-E processing peptidase SpoIIGA [Clostridia bacterium]
MELYADLFVVINMLCDLAVLLLCGRLIGKKIKKRRLFLSCLLGGGYAFLWLLLYPMNLLLFMLSVLCSLFMVLIAFGRQRLTSFLRTLLYFYFVS